MGIIVWISFFVWILPSNFMSDEMILKQYCALNGGIVSMSYGFPLKKITMLWGWEDRELCHCWVAMFGTSGLNPTLCDGRCFLLQKPRRNMPHSILIAAGFLPGSQSHYRSCSICHSWYTFLHQSQPQLALRCSVHQMFQGAAVLFQSHPERQALNHLQCSL